MFYLVPILFYREKLSLKFCRRQLDGSRCKTLRKYARLQTNIKAHYYVKDYTLVSSLKSWTIFNYWKASSKMCLFPLRFYVRNIDSPFLNIKLRFSGRRMKDFVCEINDCYVWQDWETMLFMNEKKWHALSGFIFILILFSRLNGEI